MSFITEMKLMKIFIAYLTYIKYRRIIYDLFISTNCLCDQTKAST